MSRVARGTSAREAEDYLVGVFATCTGFELALVTSVESEHRKVLRARLLAEGAELDVVAPSVDAVVAAPELGAERTGHRTLVRWIEASDDTNESAWRELAVALNRSRERLRAKHRYLWVLAGPLALRRIMTVNAQDIYSGAYKAPHIVARAGAEIGWLLLSDLQFDANGPWRSNNEAFLSDLERALDVDELVADLVLISGDLTWRGQPNEYEQVDRFLDGLCARLERRGAAPIVLAVPGNHDQDRSSIYKRWCSELLRHYTDESDTWGEELQVSLWNLRDASFIKPLFAGYLSWAQRRMDDLSPDEIGMKPGTCYLRSRLSSHFPGDWSVLVEKDDLRVAIVGLNTAILEEDGKPLLVYPQFEAALGGPELAPLSTAHSSVLLTHHGPWSMSNEARACLWQRIHGIEGLVVHLHGHAHGYPVDEFGPPAVIGGLPLFDPPDYRQLSLFGPQESSRHKCGYVIGRVNADGPPWLRRRFSTWSEARGSVQFVNSLRDPKELEAREPTAFVANNSVTADEIDKYLRWVEESPLPTPVWEDDWAKPTDQFPGDFRVARYLRPRNRLQPDVSLSLTEVFKRVIKHDERAVVVSGPLGSGKTVFVDQLIRGVAQQGSERLGLPSELTPVLLRLSSIEWEGGLAHLIQSQLDAERFAPDFGWRLCQRGRLLLAFDGLDAIADLEQRARASRWLMRVRDSVDDSYLLVTDSVGGRENSAVDFTKFRLCPFDASQVRAFVHAWTQSPAGGTRLDDDMLLAVLEHPKAGAQERVAGFADNPMLLATICQTINNAEGFESVESVLDLYGRCVDHLARSAEQLGLRWDVSALGAAAAMIHEQRGRRWISEDELSAVQLRESHDTLGVLRILSPHEDVLGFTYRGIQEYLTALHFHALGSTENSGLAAKFDDCWWQEVILLIIAKDGDLCEEFMQALVRRPEFPEWAETPMMRRCLEVLQADDQSWSPLLEVLEGAEDFTEAHRFAALRVLEQLVVDLREALPTLIQGDPARSVRAWWQGRRELPPPPRTRIEAHCGGLELLQVPGGSFLMGSPESEPDRRPDEGPVHEVDLDTFYIARTPVTNAEYARYLRDNPGAPKPRYWADRRFNQPEQPVVGISWYEAHAYCEWAGLQLPTEAQWEYACRAGSSSPFGVGEDEAALARVGWYVGNSGGRIHAVRTRDANAFGLFDMHGNVREWCRDDFGSYRAPPRLGDGLRHTPSSDGSRVYRGGGYFDLPKDSRAAARRPILPGYRLDSLGFRPVATDPDRD